MDYTSPDTPSNRHLYQALTDDADFLVREASAWEKNYVIS